MDSDDAEGAELPPIDAKNIAGAGTKRRVDRAHDPSRLTHGVRGAGASAAALAGAELPPVDAEEKNMSGAGKRRRVERAHDPSRHTRGMRGAGASSAALAMRATDSDDTEGAEPMAAAKEKARQEAEVELIRVAEAKQRQVVAKKAQKQQQAEVAAMEKEGGHGKRGRPQPKGRRRGRRCHGQHTRRDQRRGHVRHSSPSTPSTHTRTHLPSRQPASRPRPPLPPSATCPSLLCVLRRACRCSRAEALINRARWSVSSRYHLSTLPAASSAPNPSYLLVVGVSGCLG